MKTLLLLTLILFRRVTLAGNNAEPELLIGNGAGGGATFAILQPDGLFIPYGEYPHKQGLQKFEKADAEAMAANHRSLLGKITRLATGGYPVYIGHPDIPGSKDTDKRAYGWVEDIIAENDGMRLPVKWSDPGSELVANAHFKFYSPAWWLKKSGKFMRPTGLKSVGLTNDPNIPVPALANEREENAENLKAETLKEEIETNEPIENMKPILAALGLEEGATLEDALAKITAIQDAAKAATDEAAAKANEMTEMTAGKKKAEDDYAAANEARTTLEARLKVVANNAVQGAVAGGRLTPADAEAKVTELLAANDLQAALAELGKLPVKMKTASATGDLGNGKTRLVIAANDDAKAAREERATLVANEYERTNPALPESERKRIAWQRAQTKNPEAFSKQSTEPAA